MDTALLENVESKKCLQEPRVEPRDYLADAEQWEKHANEYYEMGFHAKADEARKKANQCLNWAIVQELGIDPETARLDVVQECSNRRGHRRKTYREPIPVEYPDVSLGYRRQECEQWPCTGEELTVLYLPNGDRLYEHLATAYQGPLPLEAVRRAQALTPALRRQLVIYSPNRPERSARVTRLDPILALRFDDEVFAIYRWV